MPEPHPFPANPDAVRAEDLDLSRVPGYGQDEPEEPMLEPVEDTRSTLQVIQGGMAEPAEEPAPVQDQIAFPEQAGPEVEPATDDAEGLADPGAIEGFLAVDPYQQRIGVEGVVLRDMLLARGLNPDTIDPDLFIETMEENDRHGAADVAEVLDNLKAIQDAEAKNAELMQRFEAVEAAVMAGQSREAPGDENPQLAAIQELLVMQQVDRETEQWLQHQVAGYAQAYEKTMLGLEERGLQRIPETKLFEKISELGLLDAMAAGMPHEKAMDLAILALGNGTPKVQTLADGSQVVGTGPRAQRRQTITIPAAPSAQRQPQTVEDLLLGN